MVTATERLRELLDERGVEYETLSFYDATWWKDACGLEWYYGEDDDGHTIIEALDPTPEQAIAATLGSGTCEADETDLMPFVRADSDGSDVDYIHVMECSSCGGTYEHVNGSYEFCPRCGRKVVNQ